MKTIFIVEDDEFYSNLLYQTLLSEKATIKTFTTGEACLENLYMNPSMILLDHYLEGNLKGLEILQQVKAFNPNIYVVYLTSQADLQVALNSLRLGAFDYIEKNEQTADKLKEVLERIHFFTNFYRNTHNGFFARLKQLFSNPIFNT